MRTLFLQISLFVLILGPLNSAYPGSTKSKETAAPSASSNALLSPAAKSKSKNKSTSKVSQNKTTHSNKPNGNTQQQVLKLHKVPTLTPNTGKKKNTPIKQTLVPIERLNTLNRQGLKKDLRMPVGRDNRALAKSLSSKGRAPDRSPSAHANKLGMGKLKGGRPSWDDVTQRHTSPFHHDAAKSTQFGRLFENKNDADDPRPGSVGAWLANQMARNKDLAKPNRNASISEPVNENTKVWGDLKYGEARDGHSDYQTTSPGGQYTSTIVSHDDQVFVKTDTGEGYTITKYEEGKEPETAMFDADGNPINNDDAAKQPVPDDAGLGGPVPEDSPIQPAFGPEDKKGGVIDPSEDDPSPVFGIKVPELAMKRPSPGRHVTDPPKDPDGRDAGGPEDHGIQTGPKAGDDFGDQVDPMNPSDDEQ